MECSNWRYLVLNQNWGEKYTILHPKWGWEWTSGSSCISPYQVLHYECMVLTCTHLFWTTCLMSSCNFPVHLHAPRCLPGHATIRCTQTDSCSSVCLRSEPTNEHVWHLRRLWPSPSSSPPPLSLLLPDCSSISFRIRSATNCLAFVVRFRHVGHLDTLGWQLEHCK